LARAFAIPSGIGEQQDLVEPRAAVGAGFEAMERQACRYVSCNRSSPASALPQRRDATRSSSGPCTRAAGSNSSRRW
jgi:hypothetical protein